MSNALKIPSYGRHKATGQAVVRIGGRDIYLGKFNSASSRQEYNRLIAEFVANNGVTTKATTDLTVVELLAAFLKTQKTRSKVEQIKFRLTVAAVRELYGRKAVSEFGPLALKAVRQKMIEAGLSRQSINERVNRIRYIWKWGVENELIPATNLHALQAVAGLRFGKTEAKETEPVKPVPDAFVDETKEFVSPVVAAMIELQRFTGMRSGEVTAMRGCDLDTSGKVWIYTLAQHKNTWRGHERKVYIGPKAQMVLRPYLTADLQAYLFSPAGAMDGILKMRHAARKTPLSCGNRPGTNNRGIRRKQLSDRYNSNSYRRAIEHGIEAANKARLKAAAEQGIDAEDVALIPHWHPHQLRHNAATNLRREHGIEVARIILGHRSAAITEVYAEADHARAIDVMAKIG
jgi:integrase